MPWIMDDLRSDGWGVQLIPRTAEMLTCRGLMRRSNADRQR
jgi:hypothetical protein